MYCPALLLFLLIPQEGRHSFLLYYLIIFLLTSLFQNQLLPQIEDFLLFVLRSLTFLLHLPTLLFWLIGLYFFLPNPSTLYSFPRQPFSFLPLRLPPSLSLLFFFAFLILLLFLQALRLRQSPEEPLHSQARD